MSENPFETNHPFDLAVPDEQEELRMLARAIEFADKFQLLFVRCNQHDLRKHLVADLRAQHPNLNIQEIHFDQPIDHLLDELRRKGIKDPPPDAVFVSGLEYSLPTAADAHATPIVWNLNAARNSFPVYVPCPLVLWIPEYVLTAISLGAPDFFSIRSGAYYFAATLPETAAFAQLLTAGDEWQADSMSLEEKIGRINEIKNLLADYRSLPPSQRNYDTEGGLLKRLGHFHWVMGRWTEAENYCLQSLEVYRKVGNSNGERRALNNLGIIYQDQGRLAEAEKAYKHSLEIMRELKDWRGEDQTLGNLGVVYQLQGRLAEAEKVHQDSLEICQELGDKIGEGYTLGNLALLHKGQGNIKEALKFGRQAVETVDTTDDKTQLEKAQRLVSELEAKVKEG